MTLVDTLAPYLPRLRRYARALAGSQASGDAYVRAALEAIVQEQVEFAVADAPDIALYRVFQRIWSATSSLHDHSDMGEPPPGDGPDGRLLRLTPRNRQALLLTTVEGFTHDDAAAVLGVAVDEVSAMVVDAQRELEEDLATDVLIIEDEPVIAMDLERIVRGLGHKVAAVAATRSEAVAALDNTRPGIVLADIQLRDGSSGLDAVADILKTHDIPVIVITAYPERLLTGERPEPAFLITKPFLPEAVRAAMGQALFFHRPQGVVSGV